MIVDEVAAANETAPMPLTHDVYVDPEAAFAASEPPMIAVEEVKPARKTRSRKKAADIEGVESAPAEGLVETAAAPVKARASRAKAEKKVLEPVVAEPVITETVAVTLPEPEIVADPNEISAPPEKPKRGWWRR